MSCVVDSEEKMLVYASPIDEICTKFSFVLSKIEIFAFLIPFLGEGIRLNASFVIGFKNPSAIPVAIFGEISLFHSS